MWGLVGTALLAGLAGSGCHAPLRRLHYETLALPDRDRGLDYAVYAPPRASRRDPTRALPLVVFLHGAGDGPDCFDEAGFGRHLDRAIAAGRVPPAVIVVPRGDFGFWENWADGSYRYRDWVVRSLMPEIARRYGTQRCPEGCHLIGISMGGHGALRFALLEPGRFASVTAISAPILDAQDAFDLVDNGWLRLVVPTERIWGRADPVAMARDDPFLRWTEPEDLGGLRLMLAWGDRDHARIIETNERFEAHLSERGIDHEVLVFAGGHEWAAWTEALDRVLSLQLGAPQPVPALPGLLR